MTFFHGSVIFPNGIKAKGCMSMISWVMSRVGHNTKKLTNLDSVEHAVM